MILPIYVYGSTVLRQKTREIDASYPELQQLIDNMFETMDNADGVGLAAPQVGLSIRLLVVDGHLLGEDQPQLATFKRVMINPVMLEESETTAQYSEGCLSIPDIHADIVRPERIKIGYYDRDFKYVEEELDGFACRMVQHEYSHLEGCMFVDLAKPIRKKMIASKLQHIAKGRAGTTYRTKLSV